MGLGLGLGLGLRLRVRGRIELDLQQRLNVPQLAGVLVQVLRLLEEFLHLPHPTLVHLEVGPRV